MTRLLYRLFGRLPALIRRRIVRFVAPTWTAGVVAVIERNDGRWLMVSPVYRPGWSLPGGLLDRGEDPAAALVRELREELALPIRVVGDPWIVYDSTMQRIDAVFRAEVVGDIDLDALAARTPELDGVGWFDPLDPPETEDEADDAIVLAAQVGGGGSPVLWR